MQAWCPGLRSFHARPVRAALALACVLPAPAGAACPLTPLGTLRLAAVEARGDLVFASGLRGRLAGIRWPEAAAGETARAALARYVGADLALTGRGEPDRWGRTSLDAVAGADVDTPDLAGGLVAAGLAAVDAGEDDALCRPGLLAVEAAARTGGRGVWAVEPVLAADDAAGLAAALGRFAVVEGRVRSVGERRSRTYLNFAAPGTQALTVTMTRRTWQRLAEGGLTAVTLRGRSVRARGVLEAWRSPTLDLAAPELLEILDGRGADGRSMDPGGRTRERARR